MKIISSRKTCFVLAIAKGGLTRVPATQVAHFSVRLATDGPSLASPALERDAASAANSASILKCQITSAGSNESSI